MTRHVFAESQADFDALVTQRALDLLRKPLQNKPILSSYQTVLDYLHANLAHSPIELFHILYLDRKNRLIADETLSRGTIDHVPVYPREVLRRCITLDASALILAHNHPSGDPYPSQADVDMTNLIVDALRPLTIAVHDHVVIGHASSYSLRSHGHLT
jgi:DNA repair protein RadC